MNEAIDVATQQQIANLYSAIQKIRDWLEENGVVPNDDSFFPCSCCNKVVLEYTFDRDMLGRFARIEWDFWAYVRTLFPLCETLLDALSQQPFDPLISVRFDNAGDEWSLVVQPCDSTYGTEFPSCDFWESAVVIDHREQNVALS